MTEPRRVADETTREGFEGARMHAWSWDAEADRVVWTAGVAEVYDVALEDFDGTFAGFLSKIHPDDRDLVHATIRRALESGGADFEVQHRVLLSTGEVRWLECRGEVVRDDRGTPRAMRGVVWDATTRKQSELREKRASRLLAVLAAINRESTRARDVDGLLDAACRIVVEEGGFRFAWIGLREESGRVAPRARAGYEDDYLELATIRAIGTESREGPTMVALRERHPVVCNDIANDPTYAPWREVALARGYRASAAFPFEAEGVVVGALNVYAGQPDVFEEAEVQLLWRLATDIGLALERAAREDRRRQAEERYRALFEQAGDGIFTFSEARIILDANSAMCAMHGYTREELVGLHLTALMDEPEIIDRLRVKERIERGEVFRTERLAKRRDGTTFPVETSVKGLASGERLAVVRDVSERNRTRATIAQNERLLSLGRLARGVAHEINNPLAYVVLNLEMLERFVPPSAGDRASTALASAREGAERVRRIVRDLSAFGRGEEDEIGPVDVDAMLGSALNLAESMIKPRARLVRDFRARHAAKGNSYRLGQVAVNLLVNAADAIPEGSPDTHEVRVVTESDDRWVTFSIRDTGSGMDAATASHAFDPFFTTKPIGVGTGLGLSIAHAIVTSLGGTLDMETELGRGTKFTVRLPVWTMSAHAAVKRPTNGTATTRPRRRILVVDDEAAIRNVLARALSSDDVTVASGGTEAAALCNDRDYDCVLCDVTMPEGDGVDFLAAIRAQGRGLEHRVVFMSGGAYSTRTEKLFGQIDNPRLDKPFSVTEALAVIDQVIERFA